MKITRALFILAFFAFPTSVFAYEDVSSEHVYYDAIEYLTNTGVVEGYSDDTYKPEQQINRAEFLKIVMASRESTYTPSDNVYYENCFPDVDSQAWYSSYICAAKESGLVEGYPDGSFHPDSVINMAEALKISIGTYKYPIPETDTWYEGVVDMAEELDLFPVSYEAPDQWVTRGEMAEITYWLMLLGEYDLSLAQDKEETSGGELDALEEEFLVLLNEYRASLGLGSVNNYQNLNKAAQLHSEWMYETSIFAHEGENGSHHTERCIASGTYCYGEILLHYYAEDAQEFLESWQGSPSHNTAMTRWYYTDVGISFYKGYGTVVFSFTYDPTVDYAW